MKNIAEVRKGMVGKIRTKLEYLELSGALLIHCIIPQFQTLKKLILRLAISHRNKVALLLLFRFYKLRK